MFHLNKWYGDCVAEDGTAFIGYWGHLQWGWLPLTYSAVLVHRPGARLFAHYSLKGSQGPSQRATSIAWTCEPLDMEARWDTLAPPITTTLPSGNAEAVHWACHGPRCHTHVNIGGIGHIEGLGYVEELDMSTRPWLLPFDELRWGRMLTPNRDIIWIDWRGDEPITLVWRNGQQERRAVVERNCIELDSSSLELCDPTPLRQGPLSSTALAVMRGVVFGIPKRARHAQEWKWLSRGVLVDHDGTRETGWAIHEVFRWA